MPWSEFIRELQDKDAELAAAVAEEGAAVLFLAGVLSETLRRDGVDVRTVVDEEGFVTGQLDVRVPQLRWSYRLTAERVPGTQRDASPA